MRLVVSSLVVLALASLASAESLVATTPGKFHELVFPDAVMRSFSNFTQDDLQVSASGAIGSGVTDGTLQPGSVIDVTFEGAVANVSLVFEPFLTSSVTCEAEAIDVNGALRNLGAHFTSSATTVLLGGTVVGEPIERLRIRPNTGVMRLLRIDYSRRTLAPGQRIVASSLQPGSSRITFLRGCEGRTLEITPESLASSAVIEIRVSPASDLLGEETKTAIAKVGKTRSFRVERPELYRLTIFNASDALIADVALATGETFDKNYTKRKFVLDPKSVLISAEAAFGVLPDTSLKISAKFDGVFSTPATFSLLESPAGIAAADLDAFKATITGGVEFSGVPAHLGGVLRLRAQPISGPSDRIEVTIVRTKPLSGVGDLVLP